jgi:hypothetical protein
MLKKILGGEPLYFRRMTIFLVVILVACTGQNQDAVNSPNPDQDAEVTEQEVHVAENSEIVQPTKVQEVELEEQPVLANAANSEEWHLVASYQYIGSSTPTDMHYTWEAWFTVEPDGSLTSLDQVGWGEGQAGLNYNDECIEAQPVKLDWNYSFSGKVTNMDQAVVEEIHGQVGEGIVEDGKVEMFEFTFANPDVFEYEITPFACAPDLDEAFLKSLGTYWVTTVPVMPPEFRTVPADAGMFCLPVLSFEEEGLGTLVPCYLLER